ncbi:MAG: type II toxin-antitoxin system RelE/ParE family toxin [Gammaproteobacteria bacterium]|nr:type II toxin-antitoxin system RelE/ParE family toxin [Gammaproteobacteria bacterium]MDH5802381.1 type II toxin-antitoxin system RelE/ParE family toxin [Gammaproteobacteria bacterium]
MIFLLSNKAKSDLRIAKYTEKVWGKQQRNIYLKQFDLTFHSLAESPSAGVSCDYISPGYRKFPQGSHIIFYKLTDKNQLIIARILHKHIDVNIHL